MHDGDLAALVLDGVVEGEFGDAAALGARVDARGYGDGARVVADREVVLPGDVQALEVFAHEDNVDVLVAPAGTRVRAGRRFAYRPNSSRRPR